MRDLLSRFAPELMPKIELGKRVGTYVLSLLFAAYNALWISLLLHGSGDLAESPIITVTLGLVCIVAAEGGLRLWRARRLKKLMSRLEQAPWQLYEVVVENFREEIESQRRRTLGPDSEWQQAREPLREALDQSGRSVAYWRERVNQDPENETASGQLKAAERLESKFKRALGKLDRRRDALLAFFNKCEAKLAGLNHTKRDLEESRRLSDLSDQADGLIAGAEGTLQLIAQDFLTEAVTMGRSLGALERIQNKHLAGEVAVDHIEAVADRIIESSANEEETLAALAAGLGGVANEERGDA